MCLLQPGQQTSHHLEEYIIEAKRLQALTQLSICTQHQEEIPRILQENWNLILPSLGCFSYCFPFFKPSNFKKNF